MRAQRNPRPVAAAALALAVFVVAARGPVAAGATATIPPFPVMPGTEVTLGLSSALLASTLSASELRNAGLELAVLLVVNNATDEGVFREGDTVETTEEVVLRAEPSVSEDNIVAVLAEGTELNVTGESVAADGRIWAPVETIDGLTGYVAQDFLGFVGRSVGEPSVEPTTRAAPTQPSAGGTVVTTASVSLRGEPSEDEESVIAVLAPGTKLTTLGETVRNDGILWVRVATVDGRKGWVDGAHLADTAPDGATEGGTGLRGLLPDEAELPAGFRFADEGTFGKSDVAAAFSSPEAGAELLDEWGWREAVWRTFDDPDGAFVQVAVHRFRDDAGASAGMAFLSDLAAVSLGATKSEVAEIVGAVGIGARSDDSAIGIIYARAGNDMIRVAVSLPSGDPLPTAVGIARLVIDKATANGGAGSGSVTPTESSEEPEPTRTPRPRPTRAPTLTSSAFQATHQSNPELSVSFRSAPTTEGDVIAILDGGTPLQFLGEQMTGDDGLQWFRFRLEDGAEGWLREGTFVPL